MQTTPVAPTPTRPDQVTPAPEKHYPRWLFFAVAAAIVAALGLANAWDSNDPSSDSGPVTPAAAAQAAALTNDAATELDEGSAALNGFDFQGAASHLDAAASDYDQVAVVMAAEPSISGPAQLAADDMHTASTQLRAGDLVGSTDTLEQATAHLNTLTTAVNAYQVAHPAA